MMTSRLILHTALIAWTYSMIYIFAQAKNEEGQTPVGASRVFQKTSFSCLDRPSGYYADIETGCQIYHMCDGLGRQFSYSCPNTTLFQQRMLICDHWYMVNCSRAEGDYSANLLIGQRDKPFVPEDEHQQRTPRPDLLDRPYAPDYSGESFRNQYKDLPPVHNFISDSENDKDFSKPLPTRWSLKNSLKAKKKPIYSNRRNDDIEENDLGTSFSSNYNTSSDISTEKIKSYKTTDSNTIIKEEKPEKVKAPSKIYEPPFVNPIYNENYAEKSTISSKNPAKAITEQAPTTEQIPTTFEGRPFEAPTTLQSSTDPIKNSRNKQKTTHQDYDFSKLKQQTSDSASKIDSTTPIPVKASSADLSEENFTGSALDFDVPDQGKTPFTLPEGPLSPAIPTPARDLLPPFPEYVVHDVATTQGPPIYYEWKTPSDSLEPPKLQFPDALLTKTTESESPTDLTTTTFPFSHNPFLSSLLRTKNSSDQKSATPRSIRTNKSEGRDRNKNTDESKEAPSDAKIEELQRELLIPDFLFPLESDARTGYELEDTLNSFQLKIPRKRNVNQMRCAGCRLT